MTALDASWREATEALPKDWIFSGLRPAMALDPRVGPETPYPTPITRWGAGAMRADWKDEIEEFGSTPAAALQALAAKLRELPR